MRLHFWTDELPRRMGRKLQRSAQANGFDMRLTSAHNQIARMFGYRKYIEIRAVLKTGAGSQRVTPTADEYHRAAVTRLASDNGWTIELAERVFEPVRPLLELALTPPRGDRVATERPPLVVKRVKPKQMRGPARSQVRVFDLRHGGKRNDRETNK